MQQVARGARAGNGDHQIGFAKRSCVHRCAVHIAKQMRRFAKAQQLVMQIFANNSARRDAVNLHRPRLMQRLRGLFQHRAIQQLRGITQRLHRFLHQRVQRIAALRARCLPALNIQRQRHFKFGIAFAPERAAEPRHAGFTGVTLAGEFGDSEIKHARRVAQHIVPEFALCGAKP